LRTPALARFDSPLAARLAVLAAAVLFSTGGAAIKATTLTSWQVAGLRCAIAALALAAFVPRPRELVRPRLLAVGLAYAGALVFYALANKLTTAANTIYLYAAAPIYIALLAPRLLGERLRRRDLPFLLALAAGMALMLSGLPPAAATAPAPALGNLLAAAGGLSWALLVIALRRLGRGGERRGSIGAVVVGSVIAALVCLPGALPFGGLSLADLAIVAYLGVFQIGVAYLLLISGMRHVPAIEASLLMLIEPVLNPAWAWWLHGEAPGARALAAGALILGATVFRLLGGQRQ